MLSPNHFQNNAFGSYFFDGPCQKKFPSPLLKIEVKFSAIWIQIQALRLESQYSATDAEFDISNSEFEWQILLLGYFSDAKSNQDHITNVSRQIWID